eukprot:CAMPEP_0184035774 /NCGR_PEP_ID=MMETSP0955-20130417/28295_1 /TAXON_ID=627963 /ORGANISM="Aplanochytrium sp, Strain PBS07" /LENGTH=202 /DNA_ID=CAMNT_0026323069 /DNA_START=156 /DNA_END=765 /DNA_ORIENTATION=+
MKITVRKARTNGAGTNKRKTVPLKEETPKFTASEKRSKNNGRKSKRKVRKASTVKKSKTRSRKPVRKRERSTTLNAGKAGSAIESKQTKAQKEQEPEKENETVNTGSRTKLRRSQTVEEEVENKVQITSTVNLNNLVYMVGQTKVIIVRNAPGVGCAAMEKESTGVVNVETHLKIANIRKSVPVAKSVFASVGSLPFRAKST